MDQMSSHRSHGRGLGREHQFLIGSEEALSALNQEGIGPLELMKSPGQHGSQNCANRKESRCRPEPQPAIQSAELFGHIRSVQEELSCAQKLAFTRRVQRHEYFQQWEC